MPGEDAGWNGEAARVAYRRRALGLPAEQGPRSRTALALAADDAPGTAFCLGVMQALAGAPAWEGAQSSTALHDLLPDLPPDVPPAPPLLARFDYLSTVGSAGFVAASFTSRCAPGRLRRDSTPRQAIDDALRTLRDEKVATQRDARWLPASGGAALIAALVGLRNWLAVQCAVGSVLLLALAVLALLLHRVTGLWPGVGRSEMDLLHTARLAYYQNLPAIWWSPLLWLPAASALMLTLPPSMACWLVRPNAGAPFAPVRARNKAVLVAVMAATLCMLTVGPLTWLGAAACLALLLPAPPTVALYRTHAAGAVRNALALTAALAALGVADTLARTCYLYSFMAAHPWGAFGPAAVIGVVVWHVRHHARHQECRPTGALQPTCLAVLLVLMECALWSWIVLWVRWDGREPVDWLVFGKAWTTPSLLALAGMAGVLAVAVGRATGWLNMTTLQPRHAARIRRTWLGQSPADAPLSLAAYYDPRTLAPLHLIHVTVNESVDEAGRLLQPEQRHRPLCIGPGSMAARVTVDGKPCDVNDIPPDFTLDGWLAISGAAAPTWPGCEPSRAAALLTGLANLRQGVWWQAGPHAGRSLRRARAIPHALARLFRTQYCLYCELTARFHGMRHDWRYLSDGSHFDSTAVYELLRPERRVGLIVLCDGNRDAGVRSAGLDRLTRLARRDFGLDLAVDRTAAADPVLGRVFGVPGDFAGDQAAADAPCPCAVLLNVNAGDSRVARIVLLTPPTSS